MKLKTTLNNSMKFSLIVGAFLLVKPYQAHADLQNEAVISFAEGRYFHKEKGAQSSDTILIQHAGKNILIDSGADGEKLKTFLQLKGVKTIDYLIVTHLHGDHTGGLKDVINTNYILDYKSSKTPTINNIKIKNIIIQKPISANYLQSKDRDSSGKDRFTAKYNKLLSDCKSKNITILNPEIYSNKYISLDKDTSITIKNTDYFQANYKKFTPVKEGVVPNDSQDSKLMQLNSQSLVLEFKHVNDTILLTGDATNDATDSLISRNELGKYDAIKVPHHGCGGSSNFNLLNSTKPKFAVLTAREVVNTNIIAKYKYNNIPVYSTETTNHIVVESKGNNLNTSNVYTQKVNSKTLAKVTKSVDVTNNLNNAYLYKNGKNYYYLSKSSSSNQLVEIDFSTAKGFNKDDKSKPIYPSSGKGYICVKNNEFQYGWQKITVNNKDNYYYFDEKTGLAKKSGVYKLKREVDSKNNVVANKSTTADNYYYLGSKGECLTGFQETTINGVKGKYYFIKGDITPGNKGKLMTSKEGKFLEAGGVKYWIEKDGRLSSKTGLYKLKDSNGKENSYYLKNGVVQTGFITINKVNYYFIKGSVTPANKGKLMTSTYGKFLESKGVKYWIEKDGRLSSKTGLYKLKDSNGKENSYYLKNGVVQTGFITINKKEYYFKKGDVTPANKGKLMTSKEGDFLYSKDGTKVYFINSDGSKNTKSSIKYNGKTYNFNSNGTCKNPPAQKK